MNFGKAPVDFSGTFYGNAVDAGRHADVVDEFADDIVVSRKGNEVNTLRQIESPINRVCGRHFRNSLTLTLRFRRRKKRGPIDHFPGKGAL